MTARDDFDRRLTAWFAADAPAREPEHLLGSVLARTARTRRRPAWLIPERWILMSTVSSAATAAPRVPWRLVGAAALLILALVVGAVLIAGNQPRDLPAPFGPAANGLLAFSADGDIHTVDPATGTTRAVISGPESDSDPVWSLDGSRFAFLRRAEGGAQLYVARADGGDLRSITPEPISGIESVSFSPDGKSVLFGYFPDLGLRGIALAAVDGSGVRPIDVGMEAIQPSFRPPNGDEIMFIGRGGTALYGADSDGSDVRELIRPPARYQIYDARYSPDGSRIAYNIVNLSVPEWTTRTGIVAADGTGERLIDAEQTWLWDWGVAWSNDGTRLALVRGYESIGPAGSRVAAMPVDGSGAGVETDPSLTLAASENAYLSWAPDDSMILLTETDSGGSFVQQLLIDPNTANVRSAPWTAAGHAAWQRVAP
jgi:Tol biopolymer transport system component